MRSKDQVPVDEGDNQEFHHFKTNPKSLFVCLFSPSVSTRHPFYPS